MMEPPEAVYNRGLSLLGARRPDEALACFERILAAYPHVVEVLSARAIALAELGRLSDALATCERATAIRPDYVDAHYNQALFLQRLSRIDEALLACQRALALAPTHLNGLTNCSALLSALGRYHEALAHADAALAVKARPRGSPQQPRPYPAPAGARRRGDDQLYAGARHPARFCRGQQLISASPWRRSGAAMTRLRAMTKRFRSGPIMSMR